MTDNKAEAERLAIRLFNSPLNDFRKTLADYNRIATPEITAALDAAEQRGRENGLEQALDVVAGLVFDGFGEIKTKIRALKGEK